MQKTQKIPTEVTETTSINHSSFFSPSVKQMAQQHLISLCYYLVVTGLFMLIFYIGFTVGDELITKMGEQKLKIIEAQRMLAEIKNTAPSFFGANTSQNSPGFWSIEFWKPIFVSWSPFFFRFCISLIPQMLFNIPYLGIALKSFITLYGTVAEQPVPNHLLYQSFKDLEDTKVTVDGILAAMEVLRRANNIMGNEVGLNRDILKQEKAFKDLEARSQELGSGIGVEESKQTGFFDDI